MVDDLKPRYTTKRLRQEIERARENDARHIAALEAQLAGRVKVKSLEWAFGETKPSPDLSVWLAGAPGLNETYSIWHSTDPNATAPYTVPSLHNGFFDTLDEAKAAAQADYDLRILSALEATPPAPKVTEVRPLDDWHEDYGDVVWWARLEGEWIGEAAWIGTPNDSDWPGYHTHWSPHPPFPAALTAAQEQAPKVTEAGPVPTHECEFSVGQPVRLANPYAGDDPDRTFYVTGIDWEYRSVVGHGWSITVATAEEIARGYGATDGFTPSDLTAAQEAGKP